MQINLDPNHGKYTIRSYQPGEIIVNTHVFHQSLLLSTDELVENWLPPTFNELNLEHLQKILEYSPEIVLLGSGAQQHFPSTQLLTPFYERHIGIEIMDTGAACRTYNVLMSEGRNVVAALLIK